MNLVTVVISTNGRRLKKLKRCLESIHANSYWSFDTIVLQQTASLLKLPSWVITRQIPHRGVSYSKNTAISMCKTPLIVFTDDDCVVDRDWLKRIVNDFKDSKVSAVYGMVLPYSPETHAGMQCPSYMFKNKREVASSGSLDKTHFGIGNNMSFRTEVLKNSGGFRQWLGPGVFTKAAEDLELLFRLFEFHHKVLYDPKVLVYHDNWLTPAQNRALYRDYNRGMLAAYSFHMYLGSKLGRQIVSQFWELKFKKMSGNLKNFKGLGSVYEMFYDLGDVWNFSVGMIIGRIRSLLGKGNGLFPAVIE